MIYFFLHIRKTQLSPLKDANSVESNSLLDYNSLFLSKWYKLNYSAVKTESCFLREYFRVPQLWDHCSVFSTEKNKRVENVGYCS